MRRRIFLFVLAAGVVALTIGASSANARVFRRLRGRRPVCCKPVKQNLRYHSATQTRSVYPTRPWELGNHMGNWPPYDQR